MTERELSQAVHLKAELDARIEAEKAEKSARRGKKARKDGT